MSELKQIYVGYKRYPGVSYGLTFDHKVAAPILSNEVTKSIFDLIDPNRWDMNLEEEQGNGHTAAYEVYKGMETRVLTDVAIPNGYIGTVLTVADLPTASASNVGHIYRILASVNEGDYTALAWSFKKCEQSNGSYAWNDYTVSTTGAKVKTYTFIADTVSEATIKNIASWQAEVTPDELRAVQTGAHSVTVADHEALEALTSEDVSDGMYVIVQSEGKVYWASVTGSTVSFTEWTLGTGLMKESEYSGDGATKKVKTAENAEKLQTPLNVGGYTLDGSEGKTVADVLITCSTAADVADKDITVPNNFDVAICNGQRVRVQFVYGNTAENPNLRIGGVEGKSFKLTRCSEMFDKWDAGAIVEFALFDGQTADLNFAEANMPNGIDSIAANFALNARLLTTTDFATFTESNGATKSSLNQFEDRDTLYTLLRSIANSNSDKVRFLKYGKSRVAFDAVMSERYSEGVELTFTYKSELIRLVIQQTEEEVENESTGEIDTVTVYILTKETGGIDKLKNHEERISALEEASSWNQIVFN